MKIIVFIIDLQVVDQILRQLRRTQPEWERAPPDIAALGAVS